MRTRAQRRYDWVRRLVFMIDQQVELPRVNLPELGMPSDPKKITMEEVVGAADELRKYWNLSDGVVGNMMMLAENHGIIGSTYEFEVDELDAFSNWDEYTTRPYIIVGNDKQSYVRHRFNVAHELGHLVLHRNVPSALLLNATSFNLIEEQANRFAGAFLLPSTSFRKERIPNTVRMFLDLKKKWRVSIGVLIKRSQQLKLIEDEQVRRLWIQLSRNGWRTSEPFDDVWELEKPVLLKRSIEMLLNAQRLTGEQLCSELALHHPDIEAIAGLEHGILAPISNEEIPQPEPRLLPFRRLA